MRLSLEVLIDRGSAKTKVLCNFIHIGIGLAHQPLKFCNLLLPEPVGSATDPPFRSCDT